MSEIEPDMDALFYDASDSFEVEDNLETAVQDMSAVEYAIAEVERLCACESQQSIGESVQWPSDCSGADSSVMQSFSSYMPLPGDADILPGHSEDTQVIPVLSAPEDADFLPGYSDVTQAIPVTDTQVIPVLSGLEDAGDAYGAGFADMVRLAEIAHVSSAFGSLVYDLLVSRPEVAAAVVAFAVGVVSRSVADTGIVHGGDMQILTGYLQGVRAGSSVNTHVLLSLERLQLHAYIFSQPVGVG